MTCYQRLVIEPLNNTHNKAVFECGEASLNNYLKKQAKQDVKRRISRVFVATELHVPEKVIGYYTLSSLSIDLYQLPQSLLKKLPKVPIPAALIGRLAVNKEAQGCGVGKMLLVDAIKRTVAVSEQVAIYAMVVDAINEAAVDFYRSLGFLELGAQGYRMFLPLKSF